jgi:hypothetical protein
MLWDRGFWGPLVNFFQNQRDGTTMTRSPF